MLKISNKALFFYVAVVMAVSSLIIAGAYTSYGNYDDAAPNPGHYATEVWVGLLDGSEKTLQQAIDSEEIGGRAPGFLPGIYDYHTDVDVTLNADYATRSSTTLSTKCSEGEYLDGTGNCLTAQEIVSSADIDWNKIINKPSGLDDGDDTLPTPPSCSGSKKALQWDGSSFSCAEIEAGGTSYSCTCIDDDRFSTACKGMKATKYACTPRCEGTERCCCT